MTITCKNCGQEWERDPALEVVCPACSAEVGKKCQRPSGHPCRIHVDRDRRALEEIDGYSRCPAVDGLGQSAEKNSTGAEHTETNTAEIRQATLSP